jgi:hypothetical protein
VILATLWETAADHIVSFFLGAGVGFVVSDRYRLVRREPKSDD